MLYCTAVLCGFVFADFGSGVFHWATDNYGSDKTPVLGGVIAAFQVKTSHHSHETNPHCGLSTRRVPRRARNEHHPTVVWMNAWVAADNERRRYAPRVTTCSPGPSPSAPVSTTCTRWPSRPFRSRRRFCWRRLRATWTPSLPSRASSWCVECARMAGFENPGVCNALPQPPPSPTSVREMTR